MTLPIQTLNAIDSLKAGSEVLVKRLRQGRFRSYGFEYAAAKVTRVTKARIFVKGLWEGSLEREFNREDLSERGSNTPRYHYTPTLVVEPTEIAKAHTEVAAEKARKTLEQAGLVALLGLRKRFEDAIASRSDEEIQALIAAASDLGVAS